MHHHFPFKLLAVLTVMLFAQPHAQESSAARNSVHDDVSGYTLQSEAKFTAVNTILQKLTTCNAKSAFYRPGGAGADADGCVSVTSTNPQLVFQRHITYTPTGNAPANITFSPWYSYDMCFVADSGAQTVDDNHGHRCSLVAQRLSNGSMRFRLSGYQRRMSSYCSMDCYNYQ